MLSQGSFPRMDLIRLRHRRRVSRPYTCPADHLLQSGLRDHSHLLLASLTHKSVSTYRRSQKQPQTSLEVCGSKERGLKTGLDFVGNDVGTAVLPSQIAVGFLVARERLGLWIKRQSTAQTIGNISQVSQRS